MSISERGRVRWLTAAVLLIGLTATAGSAFGFDRDLQRERDRRFDAAAERARSTVALRIQVQIQNLAQLRNWMSVTPGVTRDEFGAFVALGYSEGLYPGIQSVSFAPRLDRDDVGAFEAAVRAEIAPAGGYPLFEVHPSSDEDDSFVVDYLEPLAGNEAAFGFDLGSDPVRRAAVEAARDRGDAVGSGPVRLVQDTGNQTGFVLFSPVYDTGDVPETAPARRRHFVGVVSIAFRFDDLFAGVLGANPETDAEMYDLGPSVDPPEAIYDASTRLLNTKPSVVVAPNGEVPGLHRSLDLNIGDRRWRMALTPGPGFTDGTGIVPLVVAILGSLVSVLLASVVHATARARGQAEHLAMAMTSDLRAAENRSRSILVGSPDAMLVTDGQGRISIANLATESLFGYAVEELVGQPIEILIPEDIRDSHRTHRARYAEAPHRREMGAGIELLGRRRDGARFPVEVSLSPLVGSGDALEIIATVRDVSERRAAQTALQAAYDHERDAAEQLREADELKATFLNTISHELRTPLTAITGFTDVLIKGSLTPEQRDDYLRRVRRNAQVLSRLITEVLALARLEHHEIELHPVHLDLAAEARLVIDQLAPVLEGHTIRVDSTTLVLADVDREALTRILTNLLTNAARYSPEGTTIVVSIDQRGGRALVAVTDEGPGIPVDEQHRVFDRFFRGAIALATRVPGTGIGLAVVSDLARRSGGTVGVTSGESGGARFEVELPVVVEG